MTDKRLIVTRFAPSPTGLFQVGGVRSALFNYLYARQQGGTFILRCEDTDPVRSKREYEEYFLEVFKWLGLDFDAYYRQSERTAIYRSYLERMIAEDKAYISKEEPKEDGERSEVIRFRNPKKIVAFHDEILGDISVDTTDLGDFVIARSLESPLYHLTVVVDDHEMGITHVIRGKDHVANTPRQILIQEAIGAQRPIYAHLPLILSADRKKLSKRDPNVTPTLTYRDNGYLPHAILNFMALIGWNPGGEREVFTKEELIRLFSIDRIQRSDGVFNPEKLEWINKEHMKLLSPEVFLGMLEQHIPEHIKNSPSYEKRMLEKLRPTLAERITHFGEIKAMADAGELDYFFTPPTYPKEALFWKKSNDETALTRRLWSVREAFANVSDDTFNKDAVKGAIWDFAEKEGRGEVLWPLRFALSGRERSPDPFELASILGKAETLRRIDHALLLFRTT